jgi:hypothetical protein
MMAATVTAVAVVVARLVGEVGGEVGVVGGEVSGVVGGCVLCLTPTYRSVLYAPCIHRCTLLRFINDKVK